MNLRERVERLEPREQKLLIGLVGVFVVMVVFLIPIALSATARSRRGENDAIRTVLAAIEQARPELERADADRQRVVARYARAAPPLAGYLEQIAQTNGIEIPESQDRPLVPHGKKYEERSTKIVLQKVGLKNLSTFLEGLANSGYPIRSSALNVRKRASEPDSYDVSLVISAFDRKEGEKKPGGAPAPAAAAPASAQAGGDSP